MKLKTIWEYIVSFETNYDEKEHGSDYKFFCIISEASPDQGGWAHVFNALDARGDLKNMKRVQNCSCNQKEIFVLE